MPDLPSQTLAIFTELCAARGIPQAIAEQLAEFHCMTAFVPPTPAEARALLGGYLPDAPPRPAPPVEDISPEELLKLILSLEIPV